jgi:hypothetical protein
VYGIDVDDEQLMTARSWRWLRVRIDGLFNIPDTRIWRALQPPPERGSEARG